MSVTRDKVTKTLAGISRAAISPVGKLITHGDNALVLKLSAAIKDLKLRSAKLTRSVKFQQRFNDLMAKAQKDGVAHVIAELRVAYQPEHALADEVERRAQRTAISDAQNGPADRECDQRQLKLFSPGNVIDVEQRVTSPKIVVSERE
jgi:hypothetical protein